MFPKSGSPPKDSCYDHLILYNIQKYFSIRNPHSVFRNKKGLKSDEILDIKLLWNLISQKGQSCLMMGWMDQMAMTVHRITPRIAYQFDGNRLLPIHLCANNPCSFGLNVITLEQKQEVLEEEVVRWVFIR